jgi:RHS repeat-associated protein
MSDHESGLVRFGVRDFDPVTGRWLAVDSIQFGGGQANLYTYADNEPVNRIDLGGHDWRNSVVDFTTGVADAASLGLGSIAREMFDAAFDTNISSAVDACSASYKAGTYASLALGAGRMAYAGLAKVLTVGLPATMEAAEAAFTTRQILKRIFRVGFPANNPTWERVATKYAGNPQAIIDGAGRTNLRVNAVGAQMLVGGAVSSASKCDCR